MNMKEQLEELLKKEEYDQINISLKTVLMQSVGQEAFDVISKEILATKDDSIIQNTYKKLNESIEKDFALNLNNTLIGKFDVPKEVTDSFVKDVKIILVQDIKKQAEYQQIIAIPTSMDKYAALLKSTAILKKNFGLADDDLVQKTKMKM